MSFNTRAMMICDNFLYYIILYLFISQNRKYRTLSRSLKCLDLKDHTGFVDFSSILKTAVDIQSRTCYGYKS